MVIENKEENIEELLKPKLPKKIIKEVKIIINKAGKNTIQYGIRLPIAFVDELNIKKGDTFVLEVEPKTKEYSIKLKKKNGK
jgi:hypothetical protein